MAASSCRTARKTTERHMTMRPKAGRLCASSSHATACQTIGVTVIRRRQSNLTSEFISGMSGVGMSGNRLAACVNLHS
jgi:hypothetical protein